MTNEEILQKAIEKAVKKGYLAPQKITTEKPFFMWVDMSYFPGRYMSTESIVYSHEFAKAFFGEGKYHSCQGNGCRYMYHGWQYHLQQMVVSEDSIKYLEQFI